MQNKEDLFGFFSDHPLPHISYTPITIRLYAPYQIWKVLGPVIEDWLKKNFYFLNVLPSIEVSCIYEFENKNTTPPSDIALLFMSEEEDSRRPQLEWFDVMTADVRSKAAKTLIITDYYCSEATTKKRKLLYEQSIQGITVEYCKYNYLSLKEKKVLTSLLDRIKNFILQCKEAHDMQPQCSCGLF